LKQDATILALTGGLTKEAKMTTRKIRNFILFAFVIFVWLSVAFLLRVNIGAHLISLFLLLAGIAMLFLLGALFALPVLVPPIRHAAQRNPLIRAIAIAILGAFALLVCFVVLTRLSSWTVVLFYPNLDVPGLIYYADASPIADELWMRWIFPPPLGPLCHSTSSRICELTDAVVRKMATLPSHEFSPTDLIVYAIPLGLVLATGVWAWRFTRPNSISRRIQR
jgi:hypothetical protein